MINIQDLEYDYSMYCDDCGKLGAFELDGDYYCRSCLDKMEEEDVDNVEDDDIL